MVQQKSIKKPNLSSQPGGIFFLLGILVCSIILLLAVLQHQFAIFTPKPTPQPSWTQHTVYLMPTSGPTDTPIPTPSPQTFTSTDLGISFQYVNVIDPDGTIHTVTPKEVGNKIYMVYENNFQPDKDKYVEVMWKNPNDDLATAIRKDFLQGGLEKMCEVTTIVFAPPFPASYVRAGIGPTNRSSMASFAQCPYDHSVTYFLMDKAHPNKFLLFFLGQDNFASGVSYTVTVKSKGKSQIETYPLTWDNTVKFLN